MSNIKCDCGKMYNPHKRKKDIRLRCNDCIKTISSADVKKKAIKFLGGKCIDCNFSGHYVALDFDHRNPLEKEFKISGNYLFRWEELVKELRKCDLRCSNCHRIRHFLMNPILI